MLAVATVLFMPASDAAYGQAAPSSGFFISNITGTNVHVVFRFRDGSYEFDFVDQFVKSFDCHDDPSVEVQGFLDRSSYKLTCPGRYVLMLNDDRSEIELREVVRTP